ncbi:MAG: heat-shock protein Hsp20 [Deltaproteobacteria bacterium HGW-Deltaproteobacteria-19]|jgi:HSP20 family protein|nr:MAG: heat-shock protein Hsp20 [Deltaproteobacteria bacterium HGW-Deltaproteobacteria-19]
MPYIRIRFGKESRWAIPGHMPKDVLHLFQSDREEGLRVWQPHMDMYETVDEIMLLVEIAGVCREDLHLEVSSDTVTVSGQRSETPLEGSARFRLAEIPFGPFERSISLPVPVDAEHARATFSNGLLIIRMAKKPLDRVHRVRIQHHT